MLIPKVQSIRKFCSAINQSFYVTTPIFYVNAAPHIGHLYSAVIADAICRYEKIRHPASAHLVTLCTGTDEHGSKVQQAAATHNIPVVQYCQEVSSRYSSTFQQAFIQNTDFVRTSENRHKKAVIDFWKKLRERDHIYCSNYQGWYCVSDETFLTESQLRTDVTTGQKYSIETNHPVEWTEEQNYMFRLSKLQSEVMYWIKQGGRIKPFKFEKILFDMLSEPLPDISISRPTNRVPWAIPVPDDHTQTIYVWLDALVNYLTSVGYPDEKFKNNWPPRVQVIGKDILKFHGIYWPAFLIAAGLEPPHQLFVHSHWTVDGQKMSKSKNNVVDPLVASELFTMEGLRYFLLREGVAHSDGNYSSVKAMRILNAELADTLGNLLSRVCAKSLNPRQIYPRVHTAQLRDILKTDTARRLWDCLEQLDVKCTQHYNDRNFHMVADYVMTTLHAANSFFENSRPWELKFKTIAGDANRINIPVPQCDQDALRLETIIAMTMDTLRICGVVLQPLLPQISTRLLDKLNVPWSQRLWRNLKDHFGLVAKNVIEPPIEGSISRYNSVLFKRITPPENDNELDRQKDKQQHSKKGQGKKSKVKVNLEDKQVAQ